MDNSVGTWHFHILRKEPGRTAFTLWFEAQDIVENS
jgi:hypothetical protein